MEVCSAATNQGGSNRWNWNQQTRIFSLRSRSADLQLLRSVAARQVSLLAPGERRLHAAGCSGTDRGNFLHVGANVKLFLGQNVGAEQQEGRFTVQQTNLDVLLRNVSSIVTSLRLRILHQYLLLTNQSPRCYTHLGWVSVPQLQAYSLLHLHVNVGTQSKKTKYNKEKVKIKEYSARRPPSPADIRR